MRRRMTPSLRSGWLPEVPRGPNVPLRLPNALAPHYSRFEVSKRLLLTGHSHQAWPDRGFDGRVQAWLDAARYVDDNGTTRSSRPSGSARDSPGSWESLAATSRSGPTPTSSWSACSPLCRSGRGPRLVTTDGEFHSIRRQLDRLAEEGLAIVRVPEAPLESLAARLGRAVDDRTALVLVSAVFFDTGRIARGLAEVAASCRRHGSRLLVDAYHALNVVPFSLADEGLGDAFVVGGGYKYCQLGEGNCFLRIPAGHRPSAGGHRVVQRVYRAGGPAARGPRRLRPGGDRFAGATYDPTSHYRAAVVFDFFPSRASRPRSAGGEPAPDRAARLDVRRARPRPRGPEPRPRLPLDEVGGFLALRSPVAAALVRRLRARGVWSDARGEVLRLGPAPYLSDRQLADAVGLVGEVVRESGV